MSLLTEMLQELKRYKSHFARDFTPNDHIAAKPDRVESIRTTYLPLLQTEPRRTPRTKTFLLSFAQKKRREERGRGLLG